RQAAESRKRRPGVIADVVIGGGSRPVLSKVFRIGYPASLAEVRPGPPGAYVLRWLPASAGVERPSNPGPTMPHRSCRPIALALALAAFASTATGCARNPVTGDLQLALISEAQEIQMGQQAAQDVARTLGLVDDPALQQYVESIGQRMAAASERPDLPWSFAVV